MGTFYFNPNPDELYHWKYKYKKIINGKMRYFYDVGKLNESDKANSEDTEASYSKFEDWLGKDERDAYVRSAEREKMLIDQGQTSNNPFKIAESVAKLPKVTQEVIENRTRFENTPIGVLSTLEKGIRFGAAWLLSRPTYYMSEAASKVHDKFGRKGSSFISDVMDAATAGIAYGIMGDGENATRDVKSSYEKIRRTKRTTSEKRYR